MANCWPWHGWKGWMMRKTPSPSLEPGATDVVDKRLQGKLRDYHRVRIGDFRIIYRVEDARLVVCVVRIGDRKEVYRSL
jgi:mRNA interferase RelE/StbE